jgi:hypothetical protein
LQWPRAGDVRVYDSVGSYIDGDFSITYNSVIP